jgi:hypothetical protein
LEELQEVTMMSLNIRGFNGEVKQQVIGDLIHQNEFPPGVPERDQVDDTGVSRQLLVTPIDAATKWRSLDSSNQQSETFPGEGTGNILLLDEDDDR